MALAIGEQVPALVAQGLPNALQGDSGPQALGYLMAFNHQLFSLHPVLGSLSTLSLEGGVQLKNTLLYPMDLLLDEAGQPRMVKNYLMNGEGVWLLVEDAAAGGLTILLLLDHAGKARALNTKHIQSISAYMGNKLLVLLQEDDKKPVLAELNPANGKTRTLIKALPQGASGLCYDAASNTAYYVAGGDIIARPNMGKAKSLNYLPAVFLYRSPVLFQGHMAASLQEGVFIRSLIQNKQGRPSVRVLHWDPFSINKVRAMLPDINISASDKVPTASELAQAVLTDSFPYDVVVLDIRNPQLYSLMKKGYFAPLGEFPDAARAAERIYPIFLAPGSYQQQLYALPESVGINTYGYEPEVLARLGLAPDKLPQDILALLDFLAGWQANHSAFDGEILPAYFLDEHAVRRELIDLYIQQHQLRGLPLRFDTPLFRQMMGKIQALDFQYLSGLRDMLPQVGKMPKAVIMSHVDMRDLSRMRDAPSWGILKTEPLSIGLYPDGDKVYPFQASYAAVMSRALDQQAAARVAAALCQADWGQVQGPVLFADYQPVVSNNYLESKQGIAASIQSLKAQISKAAGAEKTQLEQSLAQEQSSLQAIETRKYIATTEEVAAYRRDILPFLRPLAPSLHQDSTYLDDLSFLTLVRQMGDGLMDVERFISQADHMLSMMAMEDNTELKP